MANNPHATAQRLFQENVIWDAHAGFGPDPSVDLTKLQVWKDAGVNYLSIDVGYDVMDWRDTIKSLAAFRRWILASDGYRLVTTVEQIRDAKKVGDLAVTFDLEGMNALDGSVDLVEMYYHLGVRQMLFAYNRNNLAGGGCHDTDMGLTAFGRAVIAEMNRLGMVVDCSHTAYTTTMEAMEASSAPCIFSHSNARALWDHERNIWDDQAKACAATGGVVGIVGIGIFMGENDTRTTTLADHVDHYVNLLGPEHVGVGLDYALQDELEAESDDSEGLAGLSGRNSEYWPPSQYNYPQIDCSRPRQIIELAEELSRRQYSEKDIVAIMGGNFIRVVEAVWK
ncbi:MAG: membrane dipeptidase [Alphaproteobacteria bacterium]|jgi:membrane dipeptidase|nr:membrane dipeptidase [Rhodospirillaceae bacterium]MBT6206366.1 membrane dipeptidase [Rhodospirillaceae bacterium]MBT7646567.1 membrane dipeptidase [Rhodospirillaceae bacterium]MDG2483341.1 membrane dipeptidase [Alphaproteobacteria bacterium]